jgi:dihydroxyacetone kinase-like protein
MQSADTIVEEVFEAVAGDLPFKSGDKVGLMINGLGGTPISELYLLYRRTAQLSQKRGLEVVRNYVGNYCTSLEMAGMSLTLIRLDDEIDSLLAAPAEIPLRIF